MRQSIWRSGFNPASDWKFGLRKPSWFFPFAAKSPLLPGAEIFCSFKTRSPDLKNLLGRRNLGQEDLMSERKIRNGRKIEEIAEPWEVEEVHAELPTQPYNEVTRVTGECKREGRKSRKDLIDCVRRKFSWRPGLRMPRLNGACECFKIRCYKMPPLAGLGGVSSLSNQDRLQLPLQRLVKPCWLCSSTRGRGRAGPIRYLGRLRDGFEVFARFLCRIWGRKSTRRCGVVDAKDSERHRRSGSCRGILSVVSSYKPPNRMFHEGNEYAMGRSPDLSSARVRPFWRRWTYWDEARSPGRGVQPPPRALMRATWAVRRSEVRRTRLRSRSRAAFWAMATSR